MPGLIRDHSRTDANVRPLQNNEQRTPPPAANCGDQSRTDANVRAPDERHLERLENENEFLRGQIGAKDKTIEALLERDGETNLLVAGLQKMLTPLLNLSAREQHPHPKPGLG
jgi:hypothetical protein